MFKFLFLTFLFFLFMIFLFGFSVIRFLFQGLLGRPMPKKGTQEKTKQNTKKQTSDFTQKQQKKIITPDEGEYVDYEEVKDYSSNNN